MTVNRPFQRPALPDSQLLSPPSRESLRGLDWFTFFLANAQTGFGPFISAYLTSAKWTQTDIGLMLSLTGIVGLIGQTPGGAIVDSARSKRTLATFGVIAIGLSAAAIGLTTAYVVVLAAELLHAAASCIVAPVVAAISIGLVGHKRLSARLGRNACFASVGNGVAAAVMGACGQLFSTQAVFFVTALLALPTLYFLSRIRRPPAAITFAGRARNAGTRAIRDTLRLLRSGPLPVMCLCIVLFHLANAAMLPYAGSVLTMRQPESATLFIAACIVVPQLVVALLSVSVGRLAERIGRRPLLIAGFAALALRGVLFAFVTNPYALVFIQLLDGVSGAVLGILVPLVAADLTRGTSGFSLAQGMIGTATGLGATFSTSLVGIISDQVGTMTAFVTLAGIAVTGLLVVALVLPETRPEPAAKE